MTENRFGSMAERPESLGLFFPFLLPYFIPVILAASTSASGAELGMPRISPFLTGMANFYSWALLAIILFAIVTGYGRKD